MVINVSLNQFSGGETRPNTWGGLRCASTAQRMTANKSYLLMNPTLIKSEMCMYEEKRGWKCSLSNPHLHCINSRRRSTPAWHAALSGLHLCGEGFILLKDNEPNTTQSFVELLEYQKKLKSHGASNHTRLSGFAPACPFQLKCTMPLKQKLGRALSILQNLCTCFED